MMRRQHKDNHVHPGHCMAESFFLSLEFWEVKEPGVYLSIFNFSRMVDDQCQKTSTDFTPHLERLVQFCWCCAWLLRSLLSLEKLLYLHLKQKRPLLGMSSKLQHGGVWWSGCESGLEVSDLGK